MVCPQAYCYHCHDRQDMHREKVRWLAAELEKMPWEYSWFGRVLQALEDLEARFKRSERRDLGSQGFSDISQRVSFSGACERFESVY